VMLRRSIAQQLKAARPFGADRKSRPTPIR
jgi:hypothetical protein